MNKELYHKYRPKTLKAVLGQDAAVRALQRRMDKGNPPHVFLLSGPSGVGKTTIARILADMLGCQRQDYVEINSADFKGIEMVRSIRSHVNLAPLVGKCRVWLIDEAHKLTNDAQNALLKVLEDTPSHVYFMLATTDPQKLIKAIHGRVTEVKLIAMRAGPLADLVSEVADNEGFEVSNDVVDEIVEAAEGSARKALVILEHVGPLGNDEEQLAAIRTTTFNKEQAIDLARLLINPRANWVDVAKVLRALKDEEAEGVRYCVLGYARAVLVGGEDKGPNLKMAPQAFKVIDVFSKNFFDSKHAGLAAACWEVVTL
jgi:DNA polymerase III gamma/tau subunit